MTNPVDWAPIQAVRGYGMLIEGKRIGLYNQIEMTIHGKIQRWGLSYILITEDEWKVISPIMGIALPPHPITYAAGIQPESATVSKAFIRDRKTIFPDEEPFYIGTSTKWNPEAPSITDLQTRCIDLYLWVNECLGS